MARLAHFNAASETLLAKPKIFYAKRSHPSVTLRFKSEREADELVAQQDQVSKTNGISMQTTRRTALGLGIVTLSTQASSQNALADGSNGWWIDGPLPVPTVENEIANKETGTRSFLKKGIYMANIGPQGSAYRLKQYAFDLLAMGDMIGQDTYNYMRKYLRLKSTVMYYDFDKVISAAPIEEKQYLTDLANKLFDSVEKLEDACRKKNEPQIKSFYEDTTVSLREVVTHNNPWFYLVDDPSR